MTKVSITNTPCVQKKKLAARIDRQSKEGRLEAREGDRARCRGRGRSQPDESTKAEKSTQQRSTMRNNKARQGKTRPRLGADAKNADKTRM